MPSRELNSATSASDTFTALTDLGNAFLVLQGYVTNTPSSLSDLFGDAALNANEMGLVVSGGSYTAQDVSRYQANIAADMNTAARSCPAESSILNGS